MIRYARAAALACAALWVAGAVLDVPLLPYPGTWTMAALLAVAVLGGAARALVVAFGALTLYAWVLDLRGAYPFDVTLDGSAVAEAWLLGVAAAAAGYAIAGGAGRPWSRRRAVGAAVVWVVGAGLFAWSLAAALTDVAGEPASAVVVAGPGAAALVLAGAVLVAWAGRRGGRAAAAVPLLVAVAAGAWWLAEAAAFEFAYTAYDTQPLRADEMSSAYAGSLDIAVESPWPFGGWGGAADWGPALPALDTLVFLVGLVGLLVADDRVREA
ncbi:hypothetical protein [Spirilliplanes yamanashiensis]|uniref:Uncharacterized protein n=1 Tax=Spirilliplanes yamanashiensis TaxID=42233 RepID=A0A8J3Y4R8_9ACTN|nr:hypothetical protein [Spirilliplanes yamanashiensis]MDP9819791.1 hypothetical protein [Spirilliplanes yamanashiensis]GIJ01389.1 hypothetical protein Sya03_07410 [Spirilliplanes yamanashiensis]